MRRGIFPGATRIASKRISRDRFVRICRKPYFCCRSNPPTLPFIDRFGGFVESPPLFHFGEYKQLAPPRNDVDLAERTAPTPCQNAKSLCDEKGGRPAFSRDAETKRGLPLGARRVPYGTRRLFTVGHPRHLW